jgi:hypothetical protein
MPLGGGVDRIQTMNGGGGFSMGPDGQWMRTPAPPPSYTAENALPRAIEQQAGDYDRIMQGYQQQYNAGNPEYGNIMSRYQQLLNQQQNGPSHATYGETSQFNEAFNNARELARTGGLSDSDQSNLRARGVSPIRAAYQNASRNMERQARLGGGRSANYNAAASRMAREQSESMAGAMNNVNAGIAEMVQRGRLTAAPIMGNLGNSSSERMNQVRMFNANADNRHGENMGSLLGGMAQLSSSEAMRRMQALQGQTSLYGTTPALVNTFGQQVAQNTGLTQNAARNSGVVRRGGGGGGASIGM